MQVCRCKLKPTVYPSCGKNENTLLYLVVGMVMCCCWKCQTTAAGRDTRLNLTNWNDCYRHYLNSVPPETQFLGCHQVGSKVLNKTKDLLLCDKRFALM